MLYIVLPITYKTHSNYHLVTAEPHFIHKMMDSVHQLGPRKVAKHHAMCYYMLNIYHVKQCWILSECKLYFANLPKDGMYWDI